MFTALRNNLRILAPISGFEWEELVSQPVWGVFCDEMLAFCADYSRHLLSLPRHSAYTDLTPLGFWLRPANLQRMRGGIAAGAGAVRSGRGLVFHLAPGNVDTLFLYSLFMGLLAGNCNVVRLGKRVTVQQEKLLATLNEALEDFPDIKKRLLICRYGHDDALNAFFSRHCHVRVIWGGDETVAHFRSIPIPAGSSELAFSSKFSLAALDAAAVLDTADLGPMASAFVTDAFSFAQQGCSSPKLLVWRGAGAAIAPAQARFWAAVDAQLQRRPFTPFPAEVSSRWINVNRLAIESEGPLELSRSGDGQSYLRVALPTWDALKRAFNQGNGVFYEIAIQALEALMPQTTVCDQTVTSFGISRDQWTQALAAAPPRGICRVVPFGKALEFSHVWDGHDLIPALSKCLTVEV